VPRSPDVTVVIPTKDRWDLLSTAALPSALGQQDVDLEVVVVDDGSTDATPDHLADITDSRLRIIRHDRSRGVAQARNAGIRAASGHWIAFLDDDDLWAPTKLRLQLDTADEDDTLFVYGGAAAISEERSWLYSLPPFDPGALRRTLLSRNVLWGGCSNVVATADALRELGGFDEELFQLCDWDLWIRLALAGRAAACHQVVVGCIVHARSMLLTSTADVFDEFAYLEAKHRAASEGHGVAFDRRLFTRWVALGHRRAGRPLRSAHVYAQGAVWHRDPRNVLRAVGALLGPRFVGWGRRMLRRPHDDGRIVDHFAEPAWLALYRPPRARSRVQATSKASSPTES
jgi:glycosyltransferase involved in cell wall biosynthesis